MLRQQHISVTGFPVADAEDTVEKKDRSGVIPTFITMAGEKNVGYGNWQTMRPGDPLNMMYWALDPNAPPSRGLATGSYSYAIPAREVPSAPVAPPPPTGPITGGKQSGAGAGPAGGQPVPGPKSFLPLELPGFLDYDYKPEVIEEAGPDDWIILATTKHGDRRKLAFRPPHPVGFRLCADHRSDVAPQLSSIVHDGRPVKTLDDIRKAGLHTCWEVREWSSPGSQVNPYGTGHSVAGTSQFKPGDKPDGYSIAWVGDSAPDGTGFCRIGFGSEDGLFSHQLSGPFRPSLVEKHWLAETNDGPIISGAISTEGYFRGSAMPFTAPLDFEEKFYPDPADSTYEYKVFLWYDPKKQHNHFTGKKEGLWRWFTRIPVGETPKCSPTKDYSTTDSNSNPRRTFAEDSRGIMHKKLISPGLLFSPRPNILAGRIPGTVTRHV